MNPVVIGNATRIYALCEFPSQEPRYIGKTARSLRLRMAEHARIAKRKPRLPAQRWLAKREREGRMVCIKWLETVDAGGDWQARERHWIAKLRAEGVPLLNLTDGGEGLSGHAPSAEHRAKIAWALRTGSEFSCEKCGKTFWRKRTEIAKGDCKFCSRDCYHSSQAGVSKPIPAQTAAAGIAAASLARRQMTHCKRHHPLSGKNLFLTSNGGRGCKECRKIHKAAYRSKCNG